VRFTVRRPPNGEVSPCGHRPSGGDVTCSVDVGVAPTCSAGFALEDRLALAVSGCDVPARGASLRRVGGRDLLDPAGSLVLQACDELAPATSANCAVEPAFLSDSDTRLVEGAARGAGHRLHVEVLNSDDVEPPCEVGSGFLDPVVAPIPLTGFELRDRAFRLLAAVGAALGAGQPLLQHLQPFRLTRGQSGRAQQFAGRQRRRHHNTAVDADHAAIARTGDRVGHVRECDMPAASPIASDPVGLDTLWYRSRQAEPHPTDLRHPHSTEVAVEPLDVMRFQPDLPKPFVHTGLTPPRAAMRAAKEVLHGLREIPQRLLLHRLTSGTKPPVLGAGLRQLRTLLQISGGLAARLPVLLLLHRQIPHIPRIPAVRQQCLLLLRSRQQTKPRHIRKVTTDSDNPGRSRPTPLGIAIRPGLKSRIFSQRTLR
jgi:hypothetical protein